MRKTGQTVLLKGNFISEIDLKTHGEKKLDLPSIDQKTVIKCEMTNAYHVIDHTESSVCTRVCQLRQ